MCSKAQTFVDVYSSQLVKKRKRCSTDDDDDSAASSVDEHFTQPRFSKVEIQKFIRREILEAVKQSDQKMDELLRRTQKMECISSYEGRVLKLQAHIKKIKKRGQAALACMQGQSLSGTQSLQAGPVETLSDTWSMEPLIVEASPASPTGPVETAAPVCVKPKSPDSPPLVTSTSEASSTNVFHEVQKEIESEVVFCGVLLPRKRTADELCQKQLKASPVVDLTSEGNAEGELLNSNQATGVCRNLHSSTQDATGSRALQETVVVPPALPVEDAHGTQGSALPCGRIEHSRAPSPTRGNWYCKLPPLPATLPAKLPIATAAKNLPQQLELSVAQLMSPKGICLLWNMDKVDPLAAPLDSYHIYSTQEDGILSFCSWKNIGVLKALPLPMACRLSKYTPGRRFCFTIVAKDIHGRFGPYSKVTSIIPSM